MKRLVTMMSAAVMAAVLLAGAIGRAEAQLQPYVGASLGTGFQTVDDYNNQWVLGVAAGAKWRFLRFEAGYDRYQQGGGAIALGRVDSNLAAVRLYAEHKLGLVTPYLVAGGGYAWLSGSGADVPGDNRRTGWAWLAGGGAMVDLTRVVSVGLGYEFIHSAARVDDGAGGDRRWSAHQVKAMLRINLN